MKDFLTMLDSTLKSQKQTTENGAIGYVSSGSNLVDLNFAVASLRNVSENKILKMFTEAANENARYTLKWLFYARDVREGLGERKLFRIILKEISTFWSDIVRELIQWIPQYGRYDDLLILLDTPLKEDVLRYINARLKIDLCQMRSNTPTSLLAKWLPSINTKSSNKKYAHMIKDYLGLTNEEYRKTLSKLRKYINIVENKMCSNEWRMINYEDVPSRANLMYSNAFMKHDEERRSKYISDVRAGNKSIHASTLYPYDIVANYRIHNSIDDSLEALWENLPDVVNGDESTICVCDGSLSMQDKVTHTAQAEDVARALSIYFSERCKRVFKDRFITFSSRPQLVSLDRCRFLFEKLKVMDTYDEADNTNIEAVFSLILDTAVANKLSQDELPKNILILSDMEFDTCASDNSYHSADKTLFRTFAEAYNRAGYELPRLIFWNINSRTNTIPIRMNKLGVSLVSGFSVNTFKMVLDNELDPLKNLLNVLDSERYKPIDDVINKYISKEMC